jgi:hypothetical protein
VACAADLEKSFASDDVNAAGRFIDWDTLLENSLDGVSPSGQMPSLDYQAVREAVSLSQVLEIVGFVAAEQAGD